MVQLQSPRGTYNVPEKKKRGKKKLVMESGEIYPKHFLGYGRYGLVVGGFDEQDGKIAIKCMAKKELKKTQLDIQNEINIMRNLCHPNIIQLFDVMLDAKNCYLIMELAPGGDLWGRVTDANGFDEQTARYFFSQIVGGVSYCHENQVVHRDLKLENLLLDAEDNIKLCDFGLSQSIGESDQMTLTGGSRHYAAPEVFAAVYGNSYAGPPTDVWSCGVILYAMLFGSYPFEVNSMLSDNYEYKLLLENGEYPYPDSIQMYSSAVRNLINRMLEPDPEKRMTMAEVKTDPWLRGETLMKQMGAFDTGFDVAGSNWDQSMSMGSMISIDSSSTLGDFDVYRSGPEAGAGAGAAGNPGFDLSQSATFKKQADFNWQAHNPGVVLVDDMGDFPTFRGVHDDDSLTRDMTLLNVQEAEGIEELEPFENDIVRFTRFIAKNESVFSLLEALHDALDSEAVRSLVPDLDIEVHEEDFIVEAESESTGLQLDIELYRLGPGEPLVDILRGSGPPLLFNDVYAALRKEVEEHVEDEYPRKKKEDKQEDEEDKAQASEKETGASSADAQQDDTARSTEVSDKLAAANSQQASQSHVLVGFDGEEHMGGDDGDVIVAGFDDEHAHIPSQSDLSAHMRADTHEHELTFDE